MRGVDTAFTHLARMRSSGSASSTRVVTLEQNTIDTFNVLEAASSMA